MDWMTRAACRGRTDIEWLSDFVPAAAAALCVACPVMDDCLNYALTNHESKCDVGVWGGTSPQQRYDIRQRMKRERVARSR